MSKLSDNIQARITEREISYTELSNKLKITRQQVANYAQGRSLPPLDMIKKLAYHLKTTTTALIGEGQENESKKIFVLKKEIARLKALLDKNNIKY